LPKYHLIASASLIACAAPSAFAQNAPAAPSTPAAAPVAPSTPAGLQDIVVTAQRRTENVQKAPIAIDTISSDILKKRNVTDATALTQIVPSAQIGQAAGAFRSLKRFELCVGFRWLPCTSDLSNCLCLCRC
jgi:iron complex outermembrane receptor protein